MVPLQAVWCCHISLCSFFAKRGPPCRLSLHNQATRALRTARQPCASRGWRGWVTKNFSKTSGTHAYASLSWRRSRPVRSLAAFRRARASAAGPLIPFTGRLSQTRHASGRRATSILWAFAFHLLSCTLFLYGLCPRYAYVAVCSRSGPLTVSRHGLAVLALLLKEKSAPTGPLAMPWAALFAAVCRTHICGDSCVR